MKLIVRILGYIILTGLTLGDWPQVSVAQIFPDPLVIACGDETHPPDLLPEIRWAASRAASEQIRQRIRNLRAEQISKVITVQEFDQELVRQIHGLEQIAQGSNRQCREVIISAYLPGLYFDHAWAQAYLAAGSFSEESGFLKEYLLQLKLIIASVWQGKSYELSLGRAMIVPYVFFLTGVEEPSLDAWERIACGGVGELPLQLGVKLDGSFFIKSNDSEGFPFREEAALEWSNDVLYDRRLVQDRGFLLDKAVHGCTPELRTVAAGLYASLVSQEEELRTLTLEGGSEELRGAAAARLAGYFAYDKNLTDEDLQYLTLAAATTQFQSAAGWALGLRWQERARQEELGLTTIFSFIGADGRTFQQGNLIQFAATHTGAHPELAQAAILPLYENFK